MFQLETETARRASKRTGSGPVKSERNLTGIPDQMKSSFEEASGLSFDDVRVHYHSEKPAQFHALAYAQGNQVYVGPGQERYLTHELTHVVQQKQGRVRPTENLDGVPVNSDRALEQEADAVRVYPGAGGPAAPVMQGVFGSVTARDELNRGGDSANAPDRNEYRKLLDELASRLYLTQFNQADKNTPLTDGEIATHLNNLDWSRLGGMRAQISADLKSVMRTIPRYLYQEDDPDHPNDKSKVEGARRTGGPAARDINIPHIQELFSMARYLMDYGEDEKEGLERTTVPPLSEYHRGKSGEPDFAHEGGDRKYDPLEPPMEQKIGKYEEWLKLDGGAYPHHAGGKNTGALCILDVSNTALPQLQGMKTLFQDRLNQIQGKIATGIEKGGEDQQDLIKLCNTYVVSYNTPTDKVTAIRELKKVFEDARDLLKSNPALTQLEAWREDEGREVEIGGFFDVSDT